MPEIRRPLLSACTIAACVLACPTVAAAATYVVDPLTPNTGACDTNRVCKTISQADAAAQDGDTIFVKPGQYAEPPLQFTQTGLTLRADPGTVTLTSTGGAGTHVITFGPTESSDDPPATDSGTSGKVEGLIVNVQPNGGSAVYVNAAGMTLNSVSLLRTGASAGADANRAVVTIDDDLAGTTTALSGVFVVQEAQTAEAIAGGGGSLTITDSVVLGGPANGDLVTMHDTTDSTNRNRITRSTLIARNSTADAVQLTSPDGGTNPQFLTVDSSILSAGTNSPGLHVIAEAPAVPFTGDAADVSVKVVSSTIAGSTKGILIQNGAHPPPAEDPFGGNRTDVLVGVSKSIVHGTSTATVANPPSDETAGGTANLDIVSSDTPTTAGPNITANGNSNTPDGALFVDLANRNYHLLAAAPVIDTVGGPSPDESALDIDRQPRVAGAGADKGADEFVNTPPVAAINASTRTPAQGRPVTLDASGSRDPDPGGAIRSYQWTFGDGTTEVTTAPTVAHTYQNVGPVTALVTVVDTQGAQSAPAAISLQVEDAVAPTVSVLQPRANGVVSLFRRRVTTRRVRVRPGSRGVRTVRRVRRVRRAITFRGRASDEYGIRSVEIALRLRRAVRTRRARRSQTSGCRFYDRRARRFVSLSCSRPRFFTVTVKDGIWRYTIPASVRPPAGDYELLVRATDNNSVQSRALAVRFRMR